MRYQIEHTTTFDYDVPVREAVMELRVQPRSEDAQQLRRFELRTEPEARLHVYVDADGNTVHYFNVPGEHARLAVRVRADVETVPGAAPPENADTWESVDACRAKLELCEWLTDSPRAHRCDGVAALARELGISRAMSPIEAAHKINHGVHSALRYQPGSTDVDATIEATLAQRSGVCQDFSHVYIALARELGLPARYVSGYLFHREGDAAEHPADATHAWVEVYVPSAGWIGFDPSNDLLAGDRHIRVAVGRDYSDVPPTRGVYFGDARTRLSVHVKVVRGLAPTPAAVAPRPRRAGLGSTSSTRADVPVIELSGKLGADEAAELAKATAVYTPAAGSRLVLDLAGLTLLTSAGVGALLALQRTWKQAGGTLRLARVPDPIAAVLRFSKLEKVLPIYPTIDAAAAP